MANQFPRAGLAKGIMAEGSPELADSETILAPIQGYASDQRPLDVPLYDEV